MDTIFLSETSLFRGISCRDIEAMMGCLKATVKKFRRYCSRQVFGITRAGE